MTAQPRWNVVANIGDVNPVDHGGFFIFRDVTGVYVEEAEVLDVLSEDDASEWKIYRFHLDKCTYKDGILSDNKFHPDHPAWFAQPESEKAKRPQDTTYLSNISSYCDVPVEKLIEQFCSDDPVERAQAYRCVGEYHGWENLDDYPLEIKSRGEINKRYRSALATLEKWRKIAAKRRAISNG